MREIYKEAYEEAKSGNLPGAVSDAHSKLVAAGADANAQILISKGLDAGLKAAETNASRPSRQWRRRSKPKLQNAL